MKTIKSGASYQKESARTEGAEASAVDATNGPICQSGTASDFRTEQAATKCTGL